MAANADTPNTKLLHFMELNIHEERAHSSQAGKKRPRLETDHSHPASAKVKKMWFYTSIPPYAFMA
jgi:hypothetical protein